MVTIDWLRQTIDQPLFPDLLWSRPEHRSQAGKLGIVGGNAMGFAAPAEAFEAATAAGIGTARVLLPDSLQSTVGRVFEAGEYAPRNPSGSLGRQALAALLELSGWADAMLLAGDLGHNSETTILLDSFLAAYHGPVTLVQDAADYATVSALAVLDRPGTLLVVSPSQLQKLAAASHFPRAFTSRLDLLPFIETLGDFSRRHASAVLTQHAGQLVVSVRGSISTTNQSGFEPVRLAAYAAVWALQNPDKVFQALTSAIVTYAAGA